MAKALLEQDGVPYREYDIIAEPQLEKEMFERSGSRTVPQIFIDGKLIGGFMELAELHVNDDLSRLAETGAKTGT
jgi:glutaredoxin